MSRHQFCDLLTEFAAAQRLSISTSTLRRLRRSGDGPTFVRVGASIRYRPEDISEWLEGRFEDGGAQ